MKEDYFFSSKLSNVLTQEEQVRLFEKSLNGDEDAREQLILSNIKLVIYIVNGEFKNTLFDLEDLIVEGTIGLIKAVDTYNLDRKKKFSSYASICIKNEILMLLRKYKSLQKETSLEAKIYSDDELSLIDIIECEDIDFIKDCEEKDLILKMGEILLELPERERRIIELFYGINNNKRLTWREIAKELGYSTTYCRALLKRSLLKIRRNLEDNEDINKKVYCKKMEK